ncbi:hypothetical protein ACFZBE_39360 [Streptomyces sp. NPDC008061]|uniref:hypothetical protein n=1 Tax=Streptomyces sp. NPDC008061 TaxID=3364805 RepID=UPI0036ED32C7
MAEPESNPNSNGGSGGNDPDAGKDFSHLVPSMTVGWNSIPSFNDTSPAAAQPGSAPVTDIADSGPILYEADAARATENTLLTQGRFAVNDYENLRRAIDVAVHTQFWGPAHPQTPTGWLPPLNPSGGDAYQEVFNQQVRSNDEKLAVIGEQFAVHINPAMQKAAAMISNSIELLGNYLAMMHAAGQAYANVDRASRFPGPPGSIKR